MFLPLNWVTSCKALAYALQNTFSPPNWVIFDRCLSLQHELRGGANLGKASTEAHAGPGPEGYPLEPVVSGFLLLPKSLLPIHANDHKPASTPWTGLGAGSRLGARSLGGLGPFVGLLEKALPHRVGESKYWQNSKWRWDA
jgi:hypothetical protein